MVGVGGGRVAGEVGGADGHRPGALEQVEGEPVVAASAPRPSRGCRRGPTAATAAGCRRSSAGPGQNRSTSRRAYSVTPVASASSVVAELISTGGGISRPRPLASSSDCDRARRRRRRPRRRTPCRSAAPPARRAARPGWPSRSPPRARRRRRGDAAYADGARRCRRASARRSRKARRIVGRGALAPVRTIGTIDVVRSLVLLLLGELVRLLYWHGVIVPVSRSRSADDLPGRGGRGPRSTDRWPRTPRARTRPAASACSTPDHSPGPEQQGRAALDDADRVQTVVAAPERQRRVVVTDLDGRPTPTRRAGCTAGC